MTMNEPVTLLRCEHRQWLVNVGVTTLLWVPLYPLCHVPSAAWAWWFAAGMLATGWGVILWAWATRCRAKAKRPTVNKVVAAGKSLDPMVRAIKAIDERFPDCPKQMKP